MRNNVIPALCITASAILWGFIGLFLNVLEEFSSAQLLAVRSFFTAAVLFVFMAIKDPKKLYIKLRDIHYFIGTGIVSFAAYNFAYFAAIRLTSMPVAAVLLYTSPIFVTIMSAMFFKEKLTLKKCIAVICAFIGCVLITGLGTDTALSIKGLTAGLISGFCYALYSIFGKFALAKYSSLTVTAYTFLFASLAAVPLADFGAMTELITSENIVTLVFFALLSGLVPYLLYTYGLSKTQAGKAAVIACIEPVTAAVAGVTVLGEDMSVRILAGILCILGAVILLQYKRKL